MREPKCQGAWIGNPTELLNQGGCFTLLFAGVAGIGALFASAVDSFAATTTTTFNVQLTITASCIINSASNLNFGSTGVLSSAVTQSSTIQVQCTNTTPYNIGLNEGTAAGATVSTRKMTNGAATVDYALYSNAGMTTNWGNTVGTDTVSSTGTGAAQSFIVYGRVPAQSTPAPGSYSDTITVTVTY